ncbi:MAG: signal peptidase I [Oscillospiraceae bacterium]|jgi:signal peptidase|nr:signal peptidase I [Oscillospiraceae bacterium]
MKRAISRLCNAIGTAALAAIIVVAGGTLALQLLGHKPMAILSGSMEPRYNVGGVVFIDTNAAPGDIEEGDVITYALGENTAVTHRVIAIEEDAYLTKGDANETTDLAPVPKEKLIGRAWLHIPLLGYALMNLGTRKGLAAGAIMMAALIALFAVSAALAPERRRAAVETEKGGHGNEA